MPSILLFSDTDDEFLSTETGPIASQGMSAGVLGAPIDDFPGREREVADRREIACTSVLKLVQLNACTLKTAPKETVIATSSVVKAFILLVQKNREYPRPVSLSSMVIF